MLFQALSEFWIPTLIWATVRIGAPSGLGIGSRVLLMRYGTGIARWSHLIWITLAKMCPGIGEGAPAVISTVSNLPARTLATLIRIMDVVNKIDRNFLFICPPRETLLVEFSLAANPVGLRSRIRRG